MSTLRSTPTLPEQANGLTVSSSLRSLLPPFVLDAVGRCCHRARVSAYICRCYSLLQLLSVHCSYCSCCCAAATVAPGRLRYCLLELLPRLPCCCAATSCCSAVACCVSAAPLLHRRLRLGGASARCAPRFARRTGCVRAGVPCRCSPPLRAPPFPIALAHTGHGRPPPQPRQPTAPAPPISAACHLLVGGEPRLPTLLAGQALYLARACAGCAPAMASTWYACAR